MPNLKNSGVTHLKKFLNMKKFNLSGIDKVLSKDQMKNIKGGEYVSCTCNGSSTTVECSTTAECISKCWSSC